MCALKDVFMVSVLCVLVLTVFSEEDGKVIKKHTYYNTSLLDIHLIGDNINEIELEAFKDLSVESLRLYGNSLVTLKKGVFVNVTIHEIDLSSNHITTIEDGTFHELHPMFRYGILELNLDYNGLTEIKKGVFNHTMFRKLAFARNKIKYIEPGAFEGMIHLLDIYLDGNLLEKIEPGVFQNLAVPTAWVRLYFSANKIKFVDPYAFENTTVYTLDLQRNELKPPLEISYFKRTSIGTILL